MKALLCRIWHAGLSTSSGHLLSRSIVYILHIGQTNTCMEVHLSISRTCMH